MWPSWIRGVSSDGTEMQWSHSAATAPPPAPVSPGRRQAHVARRPQRAQHVLRAARGRDRERDVAGPAEPAQLALERGLEAVVVGDRGQRRRVGRQRARGQRVALQLEAPDELGGDVLRVRGAVGGGRGRLPARRQAHRVRQRRQRRHVVGEVDEGRVHVRRRPHPLARQIGAHGRHSAA
jgi:hypothetical protein